MKGDREKRQTVLGGRRFSGTIISWKGTVGWIKPSSKIDRPEEEMRSGKVFVHKSDFAAGTDLSRMKGARVNFTVYVDGTGLGAEHCRIVTMGEEGPGKGEAHGVKRTIEKRPLGRFSRSVARAVSVRPERVAPWAKGSKSSAPSSKGWEKGREKGREKGLDRGGAKAKGRGKDKGKGKGKGKGKSGKGVKGKGKRKGPREQPPRKRIGGRLLGKILRWSRTFGWIESLEAIDHPKAHQHDGEVFAHKDDIMGGKTPREGDTVDFLPYVDRTGVGAEKCRIVERADGNDEGEELEELDEVEEAEAANAVADAEEGEDVQDVEEPGEDAGQDGEEDFQDVDPVETLDPPEEEEQQQMMEEEENAEAEEAPEEAPEVAEAEEDPQQAKKGKSKGPLAGKADAKGKAKGKGPSVESGKGKVASKGKPSETLGVQKTIEKRQPFFAPVNHGKTTSAGSSKGSTAGKGKGADMTKGSDVVMQSKPKAASNAISGKAQAKGSKSPAIGGKPSAVDGRVPTAGGKAGTANNKQLGTSGKAGAGNAPATTGKASGPGGGKAGKAVKGSGKNAAAAAPATTSQGSGGLPENWEEHWSEEHGVPYFWNRKTKESKWLRPAA